MTPEKKSAILQRVKDEYAFECGSEDFEEYLTQRDGASDYAVEQIAERYAAELIKSLAPSDEEVKAKCSCYPLDYQYGAKWMRSQFTKIVGGE